ncbi:MAG: carbamoyl phosphate synthase small subunit [Clostridia bacterium]
MRPRRAAPRSRPLGDSRSPGSCKIPSNFRSETTLDEYMSRHMVPGIEGIDTRQVTRIIREKGTMKGAIVQGGPSIPEGLMEKIHRYEIKNPVRSVTAKQKYRVAGTGCRVALMDFGLKRNIIRSLEKRNMDITVFPSDVSSGEILSGMFDGLVLSNGPGDPKDCKDEIQCLKEVIGKIPVFGICLGHQLAALALGGDTEKLKYGHRGSNHPVKDLLKGNVYITSQNHGYAVIGTSLDEKEIAITHFNMNDGTVEGFRHLAHPLFTVQFHPEASPGPGDTGYLFDDFQRMMKDCMKGGQHA